MGDRAQVAIKSKDGKVYLYGHWMGSEIYAAAGQALKDAPDRHEDSDYLARIVFCRMLPAKALKEETGFGIGLRAMMDVEHPIAVLDCETQTVAFENWRRPCPAPMSFDEFSRRALDGEFEEL